MSSPHTEALVGRTLDGKLRLDQLLGEGASGAVFRAHHLTLDKPIAVKILHASHSIDPNLVSRFKAEARAASRLDHPNSIRILDFGEDGEDRLLYIAMEFVDGEDLQNLLERERKLEGWRVAAIMAQAAGALALAHDQGVVHRDLKPGNIMLISEPAEDGAIREIVKVCDFGLAKMLDVNPDELTNGPLTKQGVIFGTPTYMSPEQASGDKIDARADIYGFGVILFKMLSGHAPFTADNTTGVLMKHIMEPAPALASVVPDVDPRLAELVDQCLMKERAARPQSMHDVLRALRPVAAEAPVDALPLLERAPPRSRTLELGAPQGPHDGMSDTYERPLESVGAVPAPANRGPLILSAVGSILLVLVLGAILFVFAGENDAKVVPAEPPVAVVEPPPAEPPTVVEPPVAAVEPPVAAIEPPVATVEPPPPPKPKKRRRPKTSPPPKSPPPKAPPPKAPPPKVEPPPKAPPPKVEPPPPPVAPPPPKLIAPPPPKVIVRPPPPKIIVAPKKALSVDAALQVTSISGGLSRKRTADALSRGMSNAKACLERVLLGANKATAGAVDVSAKISVRGKLDDFKASGGVDGAATCVLKSFRSLRMPRPDTGAAYLKFRVAYKAR